MTTMITQPADDFMIKVPMSMARRIFAEMTVENSGDDFFRMQISIETGERDEKRRLAAKEVSDRLEAQRAAAEAARPFSERHSEDECGEEFNRLLRMYNFTWMPQYDLWSVGGLIIHAYDGTFVGTSGTKNPRDCLKVVERGLEKGLFGEPFVGPRNQRREEDEE